MGALAVTAAALAAPAAAAAGDEPVAIPTLPPLSPPGSAHAAATDPQTGTGVSAPRITKDSSGHLGGDLRAFAASWNNQHFNQGAPKPDGSTPGATAGPSGTLDGATSAYTLEWTSQIVGGPFNN